MELAQWFETTIENTDSPQDVDGFRFLFISNPRGWEGFPSAPEIARELGLEYLADIPSATALPSILAAFLLGGDAAAAVDVPWRAADMETEIALFVENVAFSTVIPVRTNPLDLKSLATVLTTGSGVAVGAWAGVVASGGTPLILITVPVGMIVGGAAAGVGRALEEGLRERVSAWIRPRPRRRGVHTREIRLEGNRDRNETFLARLKSIPGVEQQTRFIEPEDSESVRIKVWSAEQIPYDELVQLAESAGAQIRFVTDDTVE